MTKPTTQEINAMLGITDSYQAPAALMAILYDKPRRELLFTAMLEAHRFDVTYDWFTDYFQDEHADRKTQKQDFTPRSISTLLSHLVGETASGDGSYYEPAAGTGGITITQWQNDRIQHSPFDFKPSWYIYTVEELSDRAMPFLLFNLMIRGMNAVVVHGDVLTREAKAAYFVQNDRDDHLTYSSLNRLPQNDATAELLAVTWANAYAFAEHTESPVVWHGMPAFNPDRPERGEVSDFTKAIYALCGDTSYITETEALK
ncbi:N-6 DNA methylase [uncultured Planococcus sp.]|uniref:N-6 DNA methylase n=1 Tax=uncultured Planococcus sp. TaxID=337815 RepID=UPI002611E758|nr:N-6 DNA methylase [uncultured Planococcus sp.]